MVNSVTVRWPCSFAPLSMPCSFISDFVSSFIACILRWATTPVTFTVCPTCSSSLTLSLLSSQVAPPFMVRSYSLASSPFCRQPVSVRVFLCVGLVVSCAAANPTTVASMTNAMNPVAIFLFIVFSSKATLRTYKHTGTDDRGLCKLVHTVYLVVAFHDSIWKLQARCKCEFLTRPKRGCIINVAVGIAQLAEHRTVAPTVAGSIPVSHPNFLRLNSPHSIVSHAENQSTCVCGGLALR